LAILLVYTGNGSQSKREAVEIGNKRTATSSKIITGTVKKIPYYYCSGSQQHLALLYGAKFAKEDWKTSRLLIPVLPVMHQRALDAHHCAHTSARQPHIKTLA
jgi:hypothetical protein